MSPTEARRDLVLRLLRLRGAPMSTADLWNITGIGKVRLQEALRDLRAAGLVENVSGNPRLYRLVNP